jgi:4-hydroxy-tetrahydrodipicolinate synthase/2-keto-3-deoxy-L-arabinonate dehydratase
VPIVVTVSHFATAVVEARAREAAAMGAAMLMMMPPYHGAVLRADEEGIFEHFARASAAGGIPIMVQDAPMAGTTLSVPFLVRMAREIEQVKLFKIETPQAAAKLRALIAEGGDAIEGPFDGEEAITLLADLDAGATGSMTGGAYPDGLHAIVADYLTGRRDAAAAGYARWLPLINYENRQCGLLACKALMKEGGVIACEAPRHPIAPLHPATRAGLIETARLLDPLVLRWGR